MNWGGFAGGFAQGMDQGIRLGKNLNELIKEDKIQQVRAQGVKEAAAAREAEAAGMVKDGGITGKSSEAPKAEAPKTGETAPDTATTKTGVVTPPATTVTASTPPTAPVPPVQDPLTADQPAVPAAPVTPPTAAPKTPGAAPGGSTPPTATPVEIAPIAVKSPPPDAQPVQTPAPGAPAAAQPAPAQPAAAAGAGFKRFRVGDASFDTREEALAHARKQVPSATDFFMKNVAPKVSQAYLEQGDIEKAEAWDKYAKAKTTQRNMETWGKMARAAQAGDMDSAANHAFELYKSYDDGVTPVSKETVKDKDGNVTGFNVKLKNDATGEVRSQFIGSREITEMGLSALSPQAMFETMFKRQQSVDEARLKAAAAAANDARTAARQKEIKQMEIDAADKRVGTQFENQKTLKKMEGEQAIERVTVQEQMKAANLGKAEEVKLQAKVKALTAAGYTEDAINGMMPQLIGAGDHKKTTDPTERRALVVDNLLKNDTAFKMEKDPAKREAKVQEMMKLIYEPGGGAPTGGGTKVPNPVAANPAAGGMPAQQKLYKGQDGKVYRIEGGRYVPVN